MLDPAPSHMLTLARLSEVFAEVMDGLHRGAGFEHVLLCLVTPDRRKYVARLAAGSQQAVFLFPSIPPRIYSPRYSCRAAG